MYVHVAVCIFACLNTITCYMPSTKCITSRQNRAYYYHPRFPCEKTEVRRSVICPMSLRQVVVRRGSDCHRLTVFFTMTPASEKCWDESHPVASGRTLLQLRPLTHLLQTQGRHRQAGMVFEGERMETNSVLPALRGWLSASDLQDWAQGLQPWA